MKTIKCKECGKELSSKADICPNCGYRVKKRLFIIQLGIVFLVIILSITIPFIIKKAKIFFYEAQLDDVDDVKEQYSGVWELQTTGDVYYQNQNLKKDVKLLLDKELNISKEDPCYCIGYRFKLSKLEKNIIGITFNDEVNNYPTLCFELKDKKTLNQISCEGHGIDQDNPESFSKNGGVNKNLGIVYTKKQ